MGGLASHDMRQLVWPKLVGVSRFDVVDFRQHLTKPHPSADQIMRDVDRSMWHLQQLGSRSKKKRRGGRRRLLSDVGGTFSYAGPLWRVRSLNPSWVLGTDTPSLSCVLCRR